MGHIYSGLMTLFMSTVQQVRFEVWDMSKVEAVHVYFAHVVKWCVVWDTSKVDDDHVWVIWDTSTVD